MCMFLFPGVSVTKIHIHVCLPCWDSLLVEAQSVSTWEPAAAMTDPTTSAWKQTGAVSQGRGCVRGLAARGGEGAPRRQTLGPSPEVVQNVPPTSEQDIIGSYRLIFFLIIIFARCRKLMSLQQKTIVIGDFKHHDRAQSSDRRKFIIFPTTRPFRRVSRQ